MLRGGIVAGLFVFFISLILITNTGAAATSVLLTPSSQSVSPGGSFTVDVIVIPDTPIAGMQFDLGSDSSKVHVTNVIEGDLFRRAGVGQPQRSTYFNAGTTGTGSLENVFGCILGFGSSVDPAVFATVELCVVDDLSGYAELELNNVIISDPYGYAVDTEITNTVIEIHEPDTMVSLEGDANGDGVVDVEDLQLVQEHFGDSSSSDSSWDMDHNGVVDILDIMVVISQIEN